MLPKSQRRAYISYDEGSKSIKYYNAAMRNVLTLRNYRFLSWAEPSPLEEIGINPNAPLQGEQDPPCEGEQDDSTCSTDLENSPDNPKKQKAQASIDPREPQRTRGV